MIVVGVIYDEEESKEIQYIAKIFIIGQRIQELSQEGRRKNENNNKEKNK